MVLSYLVSLVSTFLQCLQYNKSLFVSCDTQLNVPFIALPTIFFSKIGRIASEEIVLQLVKSKCIAVLLYGLEACELTMAQIASLECLSLIGFS